MYGNGCNGLNLMAMWFKIPIFTPTIQSRHSTTLQFAISILNIPPPLTLLQNPTMDKSEACKKLIFSQ